MVLVVLCCASGKVKIGAGLVVDVRAGHVLLRRGAKALRSFPFLAVQPGRQAHSERARKDSAPILFSYHHIHAITTLSL